MSETKPPSQRREFRDGSSIKTTPVGCTLVTPTERVRLEVVNFHCRGACLKSLNGDYRFQDKDVYLLFRIGEKELHERIQFRLAWETSHENGLFGVQFENESSTALARAERVQTNRINAPVVASKDPLDPNRLIYFRVENASTGGMLLATSLTNKHIFPGMEIKQAELTIPNMGIVKIDLYFENSRPGEDNEILYGVSVKAGVSKYTELISRYLSTLGTTDDPSKRIETLTEAKLWQKELRTHLTIREVKTAQDYEQVLKLRFDGYSKVGKVADSKTWQDMGEGLENEGIVLGGYLGGQLIASCEVRFHLKTPLRLSKQFDLMQIPGVRSENLGEVNRLVVNPLAQKTDIVLGLFQKIHTLAILNNSPDGLVAAEPSLVKLYERVGFKKTTVQYPHPTKPDTSLAVMIAYSESYAGAVGMNSYIWSYAFSESHKFLFESGLVEKHRVSFFSQLEYWLTKLFLILPKFRKKRSIPGTPKKDNAATTSSTHAIDPKWTKQHLNATVMLPFILESRELIGERATSSLTTDIGFNEQYFRSTSNWVSVEFFDLFIDRFSKYGDPFELNRRSGYKTMSKEILGSNYFLAKHFLTPEMAFRQFEKYLPKFNKTRSSSVVASAKNTITLRIMTPDKSLLPKHRSSKENWYAAADAYIKFTTGRPSVITPIKSTFDGDAYCEFKVEWTPKSSQLKTISMQTGSLAMVVWIANKYNPMQSLFFVPWTIAACLAVATVSIWMNRIISFKKKYLDLIDSMSEFEKEADNRYQELQNSKSILEKSYQEGQILEILNTEIQTSNDLTQIFNKSLSFLDEKFEFSRSFVMIKDADEKQLRTAAIHGAAEGTNAFWQFKVDINTKRENPLVLSSVFHSGQSILVTDVAQHMIHLSEASQNLIKAINTRGFVIVPIPSENKNWGVLLADKPSTKDAITRRDLVLIQRVAQSIGLALDKKAKLESEKHIRKVFEKYVPSAITRNIQENTTPRLGGQDTEAICLFLDIRNFTVMSQQMPAEILCELLNSVFNIVQKNVSANNGIIDKFLGDGALVTWGTVVGSAIDANQALDTAKQILKDLAEMNLGFAKGKELPPINVGIGIHKGRVIAGNIGSNERMEFTVIGNTVNIASRLEQLTKVFHSNIVISEELAKEARVDTTWVEHTQVQVRGVDKKMTVYSFVDEEFDLLIRKESA